MNQGGVRNNIRVDRGKFGTRESLLIDPIVHNLSVGAQHLSVQEIYHLHSRQLKVNLKRHNPVTVKTIAIFL